MADQILIRAAMDVVVQPLTATLTGLDPNGGARLKWQPSGAPGWKQSDDMVALGIVSADEPIIQQRHEANQGDAHDGVNVNMQTSYTRVHLVQWTFYGPNSYDNGEALRNGLYSQSACDTLAASNLYMVLEVPAVTRLPEIFNGRWWERCDVSARFNESVVRTAPTPYLASASITAVSDSGIQEVID